MGEVVCVLSASVPVTARCSHVSLLLRVLTRYVARKPAIWSVGRAAHARINGSACGLEGRRADWRAGMCMNGPTCEMLGAHVTELIRNGSPCCSGRDCAGSDGRWIARELVGLRVAESARNSWNRHCDGVCVRRPLRNLCPECDERGGIPKDPASRCVRWPGS